MKILLFLLGFHFLINIVNAQIPAGSVLWLRADQQVTTGAGNKVTNWNDVSGNNNHVSQSTVVNQPVLVQNVFGNQPSILFDGVNGKFFLNNTSRNLVAAGGPRTIFVVGKMDCAAVANGGGAFPGGGGALFTFRRGTPNFCIEAVTVSPYGNFVYTAGLGTFSNETVNDNFINTSKFTFVNTYISDGAGTHLQLRQNGQTVTVTPQSPCGSLSSCDPAIADNSTTGFTIGDREDLAGQDWQGYISEVIVYPTALSVTDIQQVEQYLSTKYFLSTGAPFTNITAAPKDNSTNINIEGDWKHSYNINALSNVILSIKDTCNIYEIRIDTVYNEAGNSFNVDSFKFMRRHYTVKYSNGSTGSKKVRLYFSNADFSSLQTQVPGLNSFNQLYVVRYSGPSENGTFDTTDAIQTEHFLPGQLVNGIAFNNNYLELNTFKLGEFWIYAKPIIPLHLPCNNWLNIPNYNTTDYVSIGDLDITGNQITVEASFAADTNYFLPTTISYDLVSKHTGPSDCNYLLRPVTAEITTTNGFFQIISCDYVPRKINHAALVYDGSTLKFYRNGFLMGSKPASGNLITNDLITKIGNYSFGSLNGSLKGYMNEVRIWNTARTQDDIKTYMDASLPNPATQPGLVAYYTFDDLNNKQGNTTWNGTLHGAATINNTVPDCNFIADSCPLPPPPCTAWLHIPNSQSYVTIGDLDIPGTQLTVEGLFSRDSAFTPEGFTSLNVVSKHWTPADVNYLLRVDRAQVTTTTGHHMTPDICDLDNKKIYHAAMTYDGTTLKFFRNGFLMSQVPCTGTMFQNDYPTTIAATANSPTTNTTLIGYLNEIRIWNVVKTQAELQQYMSSTLPNPTTQPGLLAYYTFDNLINKEGNPGYNAVLHGNAAINETVPNCNFIIDSCKIVTQPQTCSGSLGAPVVNIDFGSGATNPGPQLSIAVPGATTNYNFAAYATGTPPSPPLDGDYALVNTVPVNGAWFTGEKDHTGNVNGYMAFFNSSPTPGEFYRQTVNNLCPGTTYEFAAWIANVINLNVLPAGILPNITFKILDPATQFELASYNTGDITNLSVMTWKQYSFLFLLPPGNSSVTLVLANNNIGGNAQPGNDLAIDDITFRACGPLTNASFSNTIQIDSTGVTTCTSVNVFGSITGSLINPAYQWQISSDNGITYTDIAGATALTAAVNNLSNGQYLIRMLSAESGNINSINCRFISNIIKLTVTGCSGITGISRIINDYTAVISIDPCTNKISVNDATKFNIGDTIVMMQMKGAAIDSTNSNSFGYIGDINNAGSYEFNYIKNKTGNSIELLYTFLKQYDAVNGKVQLIRVPYFQTAIITDTLTCKPWDGSSGGVVILNSATAITLNAPIDVSAKGFSGGQIGAGFSCNNTGSWAVPAGTGGNKGEGITEYIPGFEAGGARLANGGGGAYSANTGGGGGANYGEGGIGGNQSNTCGSQTQSIGGEVLDHTDLGRVFLGGGGGGGQQDDGQPVAAGGNGGGIIIIKAALLNGNNQPITANGESIAKLVRDEGGAGGGAGGSVLLYVDGYTGNVTVDINGGDGSSNNNQIYPSRCHGPGGGGGGGYIGYKSGIVPAGITVNANGGKAGVILNPSSACFNTTHGALNGANGGSNVNIILPEATVPFKKNIDSVKIKDSITACKSFDFKGIAFITTSPIQSWQWSFGDGGTDTIQNTAHTYNAAGTYTVKLVVTDINGCKDSSEKIINPAGINFDFVFEQDACNPRSVIFKAVGDSSSRIFWSLGDGITITNNRNPLHLYTDTGTYLVRYSTGNGPCLDTITKSIFIGYRYANIILTPDTTICTGTGKLLSSNIDSTLQFCWSPASFLNNVNFANPTTSTPGSIQYNLFAVSEENNLVVNGNFSNGNTGFSTGYRYNAAGTPPPGEYAVTPSSVGAGIGSADCKDHTSTAGNMMLLCSDAVNKIIWKQEVTVQPNTNYIFSIWLQSVNIANRVMLELSINGNAVLDSILPASTTCNWERFFVKWNSGNYNSAVLAINDISTPNAPSGIDNFAIDDISFSTYSIKKDTVLISVDTPFIKTRPDTSLCQSISVKLNTTGATHYSWTPLTGLSDGADSSPVATPDTTTKYVVTGTNVNGCIAKDSVTISIKPKPIVTKTSDTIVCRNTPVPLFASGGLGYAWTPAATLNNPSLPNPVATPVVSPGGFTRYLVTVTGANNCSTKDSVKVTVKAIPVFSVSPGKSVCLNSKPSLNASGGNSYLWSPAALVSNAAISNPVATATNTTLYSVIIKDSTCGDTDTLFTNIIILPLPIITANKSNDINCAIGSAVLTATGAVQYNWAPAAALSDKTSPSPIASPGSTTTYTVTGTGANGCTDKAEVKVVVDYSTKVSYSMPNAFTPNGDGINDCFRIKYFGLVQELQFTIYNRFGNRVFTSSNPDDCWDGTYKGNPEDAGNYVYYINAKTACGPVERKGNVLLIR